MEPLNDEELQKLDKDIILDNNYMNVSGQSIDVKLNIIPGPIPVIDMPCVIIDEAVHNLEKIKNDIADTQALVTRNHMRFLETNKIQGTGFDFCLPCVLPDGSLNEAALNDALAIQNYYENYIKIEGLEGAQKIVGGLDGLGNAERKRVEEIIKQYNDYIDEEEKVGIQLKENVHHYCTNCRSNLHSIIQNWIDKTEIAAGSEYWYDDDKIICPGCGQEYYPTTGNMTVEVTLDKAETVDDYEDD